MLTWGSADKDLVAFAAELGHVLLDQVEGEVAGGTLPVSASLVNNIGDLEAVRVGLGKGVDLILENDVLRGDVAEDKVDLGLVSLVLEETLDDLCYPLNVGVECEYLCSRKVICSMLRW